MISSARGLNTIDEGDDRFASYVMARVSLGATPPAQTYKIPPQSTGWFDRRARRARFTVAQTDQRGDPVSTTTRDLGKSVEIHRCQHSLMRHQRDRRYRNEHDFCQVQNSTQHLSRCA